MTIKTPYKSEVIEEIKNDTSVIDGKVDIVDTSLDTLLSRLTASRANYLDNINNSNLATLPAISSARIGYLDNINNPQLRNISSTILGRIDASISSRSSHSASDVWSVGTRALTDKANFSLSTAGIDAIRKSVCLAEDTASSIGKILFDLNARLTSTRAGYLDNLSGGAVALNSTVAKEATLTHATYGLDKIKAETASLVSKVDTIDNIVDLIKIETDKIANPTYGLSALNADLDTLISNLGIVDTVVDAIKAKTDLIGASVATAGEYTSALSTIDSYFDVPTANATTDATIRDVIGRKTDTAITTVNTTSSLMRYTKGILELLTNATYGLSALETLVDDLESRLTSTRAGYLDYLASSTYGLSALKTLIDTVDTVCDNIYSKVDTEIATIDTVVDAIKVNSDKLPRLLSFVDSWGTNNSSITITGTAGTKTLTSPSVVVAGIPSGATVTKVVALLKIASITDTSGADNAIVGSTMALQCDTASGFTSPITAISIPDNSWAVNVGAGQTRGGDAIIGSADIKAKVTGNGTYYFRFVNAGCDGNNLILNDVLVGLRVYFTI